MENQLTQEDRIKAMRLAKLFDSAMSGDLNAIEIIEKINSNIDQLEIDDSSISALMKAWLESSK